MTLLELVKKYKGTARFNVDGIIDDAREDLVVFMNDEYSAIKDEIINGEVTRYSVSSFVGNAPTIDVVVKPKVTSEPESGQQPEQTAPSNTPENNGENQTE